MESARRRPRMPRRDGLARVGGCESRCRPSPEPISTTCCAVNRRRERPRRTMPPDAAGAERVRETVFGADEVTPERPRPLMRELPPADPFPIDALGDVLGAAAHAIHDRVQAPVAIGAQSVLGAAALAVQGHADVELPIGGGSKRPVSCYLVTIAATGERKSECDRQAL